ncbi:MAG: MoxR family ATPase [Gammaproteobacteria bacterium]|nr:MoxR family ATPase [Gammaproteobacteria bacterium]
MQATFNQALSDIASVVLGKQQQIRLALCCLLSGGHLLIEDLPGMGKTTLARALADVFGLKFQRIQFTSDLLPADILGGSIFNSASGQFSFREGPVFCQLLMADEINRATPRTQSALLEAMEEGQVTLDGETRALPTPFFVIATQNPSSLAGTYPLPESQTDRFLMCLSLGYPDAEAELSLLQSADQRLRHKTLQARLSPDDLKQWQLALTQVHTSPEVLGYVQRLIQFTRTSPRIALGLSPRGGLAIIRAARCYALMLGRDYVAPDDIQAVFPAVAGHRLVVNTEQRPQAGLPPPATRPSDSTGITRWILDSVNVLPA